MATNACTICGSLSPVQLLELDSILGDPATWPVTVWGVFEPPKGGVPASYRRFGAQKMGRMWLDSHGFESIPNPTLRKHIRFDVVHIARDPAELVEAGIIAASDSRTRIPVMPTVDPAAFIRYFNAGIQMGEAATRLIAERINAAIEKGEEPDPRLVMKLADMGAAFAKTQAGLIAKGFRLGQEEDEDDAFRGPADELPSPRMGHHRVRTVDGERRPVRDEGPADRARYARRSLAEGTGGLGEGD